MSIGCLLISQKLWPHSVEDNRHLLHRHAQLLEERLELWVHQSLVQTSELRNKASDEMTQKANTFVLDTVKNSQRLAAMQPFSIQAGRSAARIHDALQMSSRTNVAIFAPAQRVRERRDETLCLAWRISIDGALPTIHMIPGHKYWAKGSDLFHPPLHPLHCN